MEQVKTIAESQGELYSFLKKCNKRNAPNESEVAYIIEKLRLENIAQIIFDFGIPTLRCINNYFESLENYEACHLISQKLAIHNKLTGKSHKL